MARLLPPRRRYRHRQLSVDPFEESARDSLEAISPGGTTEA